MTLDLKNLAPETLSNMHGAAQVVAETMRVLQKTGTNTVGEILSQADEFTTWEHIPAEDVYDPESASQYYYHAHEKSEAGDGIHDDEHGHFHTFVRGPGMQHGAKPAPLPDFNMPADKGELNTHIIGIGMNNLGVPIKLFTVNRWVTGETWYSADDVIKQLDTFNIDLSAPSWPLNLWLTNMVQLYRPQIEQLIRERDETVAAWQAEHPDVNAYEDRALEVTSFLNINLLEDINALEAAVSA